MKNELYTLGTTAVRITFVRTAHPVDPRLTVHGELKDLKGRRFWAGWGQSEADILRHAAEWLDDCHGRAAHTPPILTDETWPFDGLADAIQREVQQRQAARLN